jgi:predicted HicB family RNase H-like nuclease
MLHPERVRGLKQTGVKMIKRDMTHISLHLDSAIAKAARIQAINDGVSLKAWISETIIRQLAVSRQKPPLQAGKSATGDRVTA